LILLIFLSFVIPESMNEGVFQSMWIPLNFINFSVIAVVLFNFAWTKKLEKREEHTPDGPVITAYETAKMLLKTVSAFLILGIVFNPSDIKIWITFALSAALYIPYTVSAYRCSRHLYKDEKKNTQVFRCSMKHMFIVNLGMIIAFIAFLIFMDYLSDPRLDGVDLQFFGIMTALCFIFAGVFASAFCLFNPIKISEQMLYGHRRSNTKKRAAWKDIARVDKKRYFFLPYLYLYNTEGIILMILPDKWIRKQGEFEAAIAEYTDPGHPLREFFVGDTPNNHSQ
jgi:hypothetical protein